MRGDGLNLIHLHGSIHVFEGLRRFRGWPRQLVVGVPKAREGTTNRRRSTRKSPSSALSAELATRLASLCPLMASDCPAADTDNKLSLPPRRGSSGGIPRQLAD